MRTIEKAGGDERGLVGKMIPLAADLACFPLAFSIVLTDREPGTGHTKTTSFNTENDLCTFNSHARSGRFLFSVEQDNEP